MNTALGSKLKNAARSAATILPAILIGIALMGAKDEGKSKAKKGEPQTLTIKGSDTMVHLVTAWSEAYMKAHKEADISVTGGGSGTGIAALLNGTTDICSASREMKPEEKKTAEQKGIKLREVVVARDGLAIIVHPSNPVSVLTQDQIKKIYTGVYKNWKEVGGSDQPIIALSRESSSGTYVFVQEHVLKKEDYAQTVRLMPATAAIVEGVGNDNGGIGYVGLGYAAKAKDKVKILQIKADDAAPAVSPSEETVKSGKYSISRPLFLYLNGSPGGIIDGFINFSLSEAGQKIVSENDYVREK